MTEVRDVPVIDVLRLARDILTPPEAWTQGAYARDAFGEPLPASAVDIGTGKDKCYCMVGAVALAYQMSYGISPWVVTRKFEQAWNGAVPAVDAIAVAIGLDMSSEVPDFNDDENTTHAMILDVLDRAIATQEVA